MEKAGGAGVVRRWWPRRRRRRRKRKAPMAIRAHAVYEALVVSALRIITMDLK